MYVMGNYPKCYNQVNAREYPSVLKDSRVFWVGNRIIRQASVTRSADPEETEKRIKELEKIIADVEEIKDLLKLSPEEQLKILEDAEEDEDDLDSHNLLLKRRLEKDEVDEPEDALMASERESAKYAGTYHALEYKTASLENFYKKIDSRVSTEGDSFMRCILEGHKDLSSDKDRFLTDIGCGN